jgi:hypothetical protein
LYPDVSDADNVVIGLTSPAAGDKGESVLPHVTAGGVSGDPVALLYALRSPRFYCVFSFLEALIVVYVWGELVFPATYCNDVRPLSLYYYPILMCLLELTKFNLYVATKLCLAKRYSRAVLSLLHVGMVWLSLWISVSLGLYFVCSLLVDSLLRLYSSVMSLVYHLTGWSASSWPRPSSVNGPSAGPSSLEVTSNPLTVSAPTGMDGARTGVGAALDVGGSIELQPNFHPDAAGENL